MAKCTSCNYEGSVVDYRELSVSGQPMPVKEGKAVFYGDGSIGFTPLPGSGKVTLFYSCPACGSVGVMIP